MASSDDLEFPINVNSFLCLEWPETFSALTEFQENPSLLVSENEHNEIVGFVPVDASDVYPTPLIENSNIDQETLARPSSIGQEIISLAQNQSFHQSDDYPKYFNAVENFNDMPSFNFSNGQRESEYSASGVLTSTNKIMTTGLQSIDSQHGLLTQSHQQPQLCQTIPDLSEEPYISAMVRSTLQEMEKTNGHTNLNPIHGLEDQYFYPPMFQEEEYDHNSFLFDQLKQIHENEQMQQPNSSNMSTPISMGTLLNNQCQSPFPSTPNTITNPEYRTPMICNTPLLQKSGNYSPFTHTSYESDPFAYAFQNSSSLKPSRRTRGRPRRYESSMPTSLTSTTPQNMPLVPTTQRLLTSPRHNYRGQDKGKQHVTAMPSLNPTLYNQCQNSYRNSMIQPSGELRQRNYYDQFENESSSSKKARIMFPFQDRSIADSSIVPSWQDGTIRSNAANHHEERSTKNTMYDPLYACVGLPIDPHLRSF